jgi:hypothetical protein
VGGVHGLTVGVGVGVGVGTGEGEGVGVGSGVGVSVGVATGAGFLIATPLFQTSFVPDLTQVNFFPPAVAVVPALVHLAPALGAAALSGVVRVMIRKTMTLSVLHFFTVLTTYFLICKAI